MFFGTFSFCSLWEQKSNQKQKKIFNLFFSLKFNSQINRRNVAFFKQAKCCCNCLILFPLTRKKRRKPSFTIFSFQNNNICREWVKVSLTHKCNAIFNGIYSTSNTFCVSYLDQLGRASARFINSLLTISSYFEIVDKPTSGGELLNIFTIHVVVCVVSIQNTIQKSSVFLNKLWI